MPTSDHDRSEIDLRGIVLFTASSYALAWLVCLPIWLNGQDLEDPRAGWILPSLWIVGLIATRRLPIKSPT